MVERTWKKMIPIMVKKASPAPGSKSNEEENRATRQKGGGESRKLIHPSYPFHQCYSFGRNAQENRQKLTEDLKGTLTRICGKEVGNLPKAMVEGVVNQRLEREPLRKMIRYSFPDFRDYADEAIQAYSDSNFEGRRRTSRSTSREDIMRG